ncbi:hypothetical protein EFL77_09075 [Pediococcus pentosaceus]|uniref:hypothetical protein n=1 Tax=Pediococcus pentosaceus TaxID=1255 RepID=UPI00223C2677|nr:hypothetical protein [Pediococcus pentosaceus]MCT1178647.1 hypothetical protein [Pediococcus pentosaceus]
MANMSSATGVFEFDYETIADKEGKKHIKNFLSLINKYLSNVEYCTWLSNDIEEVLQEVDDAEEDGFSPCIDFEGTGRWAYATNMENYFSWLSELSDSDDNKVLIALESYFSSLGRPFLTIRYVDIETGAQLYTGGTMELTAHAVNEEEFELNVNQID